MRIKLNIREDDKTGSIEVYPYKTNKGNPEQFHGLTVYCRAKGYGVSKDREYEVSWPSFGAVSLEDALIYGEAIEFAVGIANLWRRVDLGLEPATVLTAHPLILTEKEHRAYWDEREESKAK